MATEECTNPRCTRMGGDWTKGDFGRCIGYHCPRCGEPCSFMGHSACDITTTEIKAGMITSKYISDSVVDWSPTLIYPRPDYFYLAGPMSGYHQFNFPEFGRIAAALRRKGYTIVSPHELDGSLMQAEVKAATGSETRLAAHSPIWRQLLKRDAAIVMDENCIGVIAIPGWEYSFGAAQIEVYLADRFRKQTLAYSEGPDGEPVLVMFNYDEHMGGT